MLPWLLPDSNAKINNVKTSKIQRHRLRRHRHRGAMRAVSRWQIQFNWIRTKICTWNVAIETWAGIDADTYTATNKIVLRFNTYMFSVLFICLALTPPNDHRIPACALPFHPRQPIIISGKRTREIARIIFSVMCSKSVAAANFVCHAKINKVLGKSLGRGAAVRASSYRWLSKYGRFSHFHITAR